MIVCTYNNSLHYSIRACRRAAPMEIDQVLPIEVVNNLPILVAINPSAGILSLPIGGSKQGTGYRPFFWLLRIAWR